MKYLLFIIWIFLVTVSCLPQEIELASESVRQEKSLCNSFNRNGFEGILSVDNLAGNNRNRNSYNTQSSVVKFINIPTYFYNDRSSYIQIHQIRYERNRPIPDRSSLPILYFNDRSNVTLTRKTVIDHISISETNARDIRDFLYNYKFILNDTSGWDALNIGIYNSIDKPIREHQVQILIPPFDSDPHTFRENKRASPSLVLLHPFSEFLDDGHSSDFFLERSQRSCGRYF